MQINIANNSVDRMPIFFHMLLPRSCASKWYQWLRIWLSRNIRFVGVNVGMSARNRHFQTNYWCITKYTEIGQRVPVNVWRHALSDSDGGHKLSEPTCSIVYATYYIHMAWISDYTYATYETNIQGRKWAITTLQCVLYRTIFYSVWRR